MERAARARLASAVSSASWFVARALWVVLHVFLWTRSVGRAAVDRAFRVSGLAFLEPRRGLAFCARKLRRALEVGSFKTPWADHGERPPPPRTLAVIVNDPDEASSSRCLADIARVLVWAADAGIRHVSLYDQDGCIRARASRLAELVVRATVRAESESAHFAPPASAYAFRRANGDGAMETVERFECGGKATRRPSRRGERNPASNESETARNRKESARVPSPPSASADKAETHASTTVDLLRAGDGAAALLDAARRWGEPAGPLGIVAGDPETGETSVALLEAWMAANGSLLPVVEVTVVFGKHFHLAGYPPWQLHKTEMYRLRSLSTFSRRKFGDVLREYAGVSKRHGK